jgi:hypothetical protein
LGSIQIVSGDIPHGNLHAKATAILTLRNTEGFDFRVQAIEIDGILLDTVTTIRHNHMQFSPVFSNGGKLLFTPKSLFADVTAGTIDMELIGYNGTVATVNLNAGHSIEFEPASFTITSSMTNTEAVLVFIDEAQFLVHPGERKQIVTIEIAPLSQSYRNHDSGQGIIPVVIYGSANLDVSSIDIGSLSLTDQDLKIDRLTNHTASIDHINNDRYPDLVVTFKNDDSGFLRDLSHATLVGNLSDGTTISGKADLGMIQ